MKVTSDVDIGSYVGAPVVLRDGAVFGTLCAIDQGDRSFDGSEVDLLMVLARLLASLIDRDALIEEREVARQSAESRAAALARAQTELAEAAGRTAAIIAASPAAIYTLDADGRVTSWNPAAETIFGWPAEEVLGELLPVRTGTEQEATALKAAMRAGEPRAGLEIRSYRKDGSPLDVLLSVVPLDGDGSLLFLAEDLTPVRQAQAAMQETGAHLSSLIHQAPIAIHAVELRSGRVTLWNPAAERLYGWAADEVIGRPLPIAEGLEADDPVTHVTESVGMETVRRRKDGELVQVAMSLAPFTIAPERRRQVIAFSQDITRRKQAEAALAQEHALTEASLAQLRAVLDAANDAMIVVDTEHRISMVNKAYEQWVSATSPGQRLGRRIEELYPGIRERLKDPDRYIDFLDRSLQDYSYEAYIETERERPTRAVLAVAALPVKGPDGVAIARLYVFRDVTREREVARLQQAFIEMINAELARAAEIQAGLLPRHTPQAVGLDLAAQCISAHEIGGDFYDWAELPDGRVWLTLADVMGKGVPAALLMTATRSALRSTLAESADPGEHLTRAGASLEPTLSAANAFVTLISIHYDPATGQFRYIDAGHGYGCLLRASGEVLDLASDNLPLGVGDDTALSTEWAQLDPGDALVIYSDGVADAMTNDGGSVAVRIAQLAGDAHNAASVVQRVLGAAQAGTPEDDMTILVLRRS